MTALLEVRNFSLRAGAGTRPPLTFAATAGSVLLVRGENGAGKTSLLRLLVGLREIPGASVHWCGRNVTGWAPAQALRAGLIYMAQAHTVFGGLSVRENLRLRAAAARRPVTDCALESLLSCAPQLHDRLDEPASSLSGGFQRLISLLSCLICAPRLLLLDEPLAGLTESLSTQAVRLIATAAAEHQVAFVIAEHRGEGLVRLSEQVVRLD